MHLDIWLKDPSRTRVRCPLAQVRYHCAKKALTFSPDVAEHVDFCPVELACSRTLKILRCQCHDFLDERCAHESPTPLQQQVARQSRTFFKEAAAATDDFSSRCLVPPFLLETKPELAARFIGPRTYATASKGLSKIATNDPQSCRLTLALDAL